MDSWPTEPEDILPSYNDVAPPEYSEPPPAYCKDANDFKKVPSLSPKQAELEVMIADPGEEEEEDCFTISQEYNARVVDRSGICDGRWYLSGPSGKQSRKRGRSGPFVPIVVFMFVGFVTGNWYPFIIFASIYLYLCYITNCYTTSTPKYLFNGIYDPQKCAEYFNRIQSIPPIIKWKCRCWSMKSDKDDDNHDFHWDHSRQDSDATHFAEKELTFTSWTDISEDWRTVIKEHPMSRIDCDASFTMHQSCEEVYNTELKKWLQENKKDVYQEFKVAVTITGMKTRILTERETDTAPCWVSMLVYVYSSIWGLSLVFRYAFCNLAPRQKYTFKKEVVFHFEQMDAVLVDQNENNESKQLTQQQKTKVVEVEDCFGNIETQIVPINVPAKIQKTKPQQISTRVVEYEDCFGNIETEIIRNNVPAQIQSNKLLQVHTRVVEVEDCFGNIEKQLVRVNIPAKVENKRKPKRNSLR